MMTNYEIEKEFREDSRDKKITARSARKRVGLRRGCNFTYRTPCEQRAMNGPCITYNLNIPMDWEGLQTLPKHIQNQYISSLNRRFGASQDMVAAMLKAEDAQMEQFCSLFKESAEPDQDAWEDFLTTPMEAPRQNAADIQKAELAKLAKAIENFRRERGLSATALGTALSLSPQSIRCYERGKRTLRQTKLFMKDMAAWGRTTVDEMMAASEKAKESLALVNEVENKEIRVAEAKRLGKAIRAFRTKRNMTTMALANELSVSSQTIYNYEHGLRSLSNAQSFARKVAEFGRTTITEMLDAAEREEPGKREPDVPEAVSTGDTCQRVAALLNFLHDKCRLTNGKLAEELDTPLVSISRARHGKIGKKKAHELLEKLKKLAEGNPPLMEAMDMALTTKEEPVSDAISAPVSTPNSTNLVGSPATVLLAIQALMVQMSDDARVSVQVTADSPLPIQLLASKAAFTEEGLRNAE